MSIDINSDTGESFGAYTIGHDAGLFRSITSANVAAGFHAGDPSVLRDTIRSPRRTVSPSARTQDFLISSASAAASSTSRRRKPKTSCSTRSPRSPASPPPRA